MGSSDSQRRPSTAESRSSAPQSATEWTLGDWIETTRKLQLEAYGADLHNRDGEEYADSVMMNVLAATDELHEYLQETNWKPWARPRGRHDREKAVGELVDALHFIANLLVLERVDGLELTRRYAAKVEENRRRQQVGYDGRSTKCVRCHRDEKEHDGELVRHKFMGPLDLE